MRLSLIHILKVEKVKEENGELELSITASPEEVDKAFTDGLDVFIDQFQLRGLEGETALQKIYNAMSPEEARDAVSSAVISYLIPFALDQENIIPMTSSSVDAESDPVAVSYTHLDVYKRQRSPARWSCCL